LNTHGAKTVEVQGGVLDLEPVASRDAVGELGNESLADLFDTAALTAYQMVMVLRITGHVGVHMSRSLQSPGGTHRYERLEHAKDGGTSELGMLGTQVIVELLR